MSLATEIFAAFCLVFLAGLAQSFLAIPGVERAFLSPQLTNPDGLQGATLPDDLALISIISGGLGLVLVPVALTHRARRRIVSALLDM